VNCLQLSKLSEKERDEESEGEKKLRGLTPAIGRGKYSVEGEINWTEGYDCPPRERAHHRERLKRDRP